MAMDFGSILGLAGTGIQAFGSGKSGGATTSAGSTGYDIYKTRSQDPYAETYSRNSLDALSRGEDVPWWAKNKKVIQKDMTDQSYLDYYGRAGERTGLMQTATQTGALTGLGPRSTMAQTSKVGRDYAARENAIMAEIAKMGVAVNSSSEAANLQTRVQNRDEYSAMPISTQGQTSNNQDMWGGIGSLLGNQQFMGGLTSMFGGSNSGISLGGYGSSGNSNEQIPWSTEGAGQYSDNFSFGGGSSADGYGTGGSNSGYWDMGA